MPYKLQINNHFNIIEVIYTNKTDYSARLKALKEVTNYINKNSIKYNLLINVQNILTELTTSQEYEFGVRLAESKEIRGAQVAVLKKQGSDENKFINTVALNRGYSLKVFTKYEDALNWLQD